MPWTAVDVVVSLLLFILAGLLEIGGGYAIWIAIREQKWPALFIPVGIVALIAYGFVPTLQPFSSFGRIFAVYGGFFIVLSYVWAYVFDGFKVDTGDIVGALIALAGVCVCWFWPRSEEAS
jgi:drug/metabolite transporter superfamily protein YnfA